MRQKMWLSKNKIIGYAAHIRLGKMRVDEQCLSVFGSLRQHLFLWTNFNWAINRNLNCEQKSTAVSQADGML
jgi:hypothetical protein